MVWLVVEDTMDANGDGVRRQVYGLNDAGGRLREVTITDPVRHARLLVPVAEVGHRHGRKLNRIEEYRTPAAHNVTSSTVDEFLNPSHNGDFTNDTNTLEVQRRADRGL